MKKTKQDLKNYFKKKSKKIKKTTDNIYKEHLKNNNRLEKAKKSLKNKKRS